MRIFFWYTVQRRFSQQTIKQARNYGKNDRSDEYARAMQYNGKHSAMTFIATTIASDDYKSLSLPCHLQWQFSIVLRMMQRILDGILDILNICGIEMLQFSVLFRKYGTCWNTRDRKQIPSRSSFRMPPVCAVPIDAAVKIIQQFIENFKHHDLPAWSDPVWGEMSRALESLGFHWTPKCFYTNVREDRRNILSMAREQLGVQLQPPITANLHSEHSEEDSAEDSSGDLSVEDESFGRNESIKNLFLTEAEWNEIKP